MIVSSARPAMISSPIFSARSRASVLTRTASATCAGVGRRPPHDFLQPVVADEGDVVEIDLRLDLGRQRGVLGNAAQHGRAQQADEERARDAVPTAAARLLVVPRNDPTSPARLLGRGGDQHVEQQRHQRSLPDAEQDEAEEDGDRAPIVAHDEGEPQSAIVQSMKP